MLRLFTDSWIHNWDENSLLAACWLWNGGNRGQAAHSLTGYEENDTGKMRGKTPSAVVGLGDEADLGQRPAKRFFDRLLNLSISALSTCLTSSWPQAMLWPCTLAEAIVPTGICKFRVSTTQSLYYFEGAGTRAHV